jgi:hypothetical protein
MLPGQAPPIFVILITWTSVRLFQLKTGYLDNEQLLKLLPVENESAKHIFFDIVLKFFPVVKNVQRYFSLFEPKFSYFRTLGCEKTSEVFCGGKAEIEWDTGLINGE